MCETRPRSVLRVNFDARIGKTLCHRINNHLDCFHQQSPSHHNPKPHQPGGPQSRKVRSQASRSSQLQCAISLFRPLHHLSCDEQDTVSTNDHFDHRSDTLRLAFLLWICRCPCPATGGSIGWRKEAVAMLLLSCNCRSSLSHCPIRFYCQRLCLLDAISRHQFRRDVINERCKILRQQVIHPIGHFPFVNCWIQHPTTPDCHFGSVAPDAPRDVFDMPLAVSVCKMNCATCPLVPDTLLSRWTRPQDRRIFPGYRDETVRALHVVVGIIAEDRIPPPVAVGVRDLKRL